MNVDEDTLFTNFNKIVGLVKSYENFFRKHLKDENVTVGELPILMAIYNNQDINQISLVKLFHVTEANISKTTKNLYKKGFLYKEIDEENNTKKLLYLTDEGKVLCEKIFVLFVKWRDSILDGMDDEELEPFLKVLDSISENAEKTFN